MSELERFRFGDGPALADELLALVLDGTKTATCWAERDGQQTHVGKRMIACDAADRPRAILETVSLECRRFDQVDAAFAAAEGEGDRSLTHWRDAHRRYFERNGGYAPDMILWCETFRLVTTLSVYADPSPSSSPRA